MGNPKNPKVPGLMREVVKANIRSLMERVYKDSRNRPKSLAKDAEISLSSVQRMLEGTTGATIDNLEAVASALDVSVYQLLLPNLDAENPQIVQGAAKGEERLYRMMKRDMLTQKQEQQ